MIANTYGQRCRVERQERRAQPWEEERAVGYLDALRDLRALLARGMTTDQAMQAMRQKADALLFAVLRR